jgi:hypothetical protein
MDVPEAVAFGKRYIVDAVVSIAIAPLEPANVRGQ